MNDYSTNNYQEIYDRTDNRNLCQIIHNAIGDFNNFSHGNLNFGMVNRDHMPFSFLNIIRI